MIILDGKKTAQIIRHELREQISQLTQQGIRPPGLAVILCGKDPASQIYVRNKANACVDVGIRAESFHLPENVQESELVQLIHTLNEREDIDGILLQLPLPSHLHPAVSLLSINPRKDVDGFHPENAGRLALGLPCLKPCTPQGIMELLRHYDLSCEGKKAVVVGRSNIVGKPLSLLLAEPLEYANATVTICHSRTQDLARECREADFLFLAIGSPHLIDQNYVKKGACVVDIGITRTPTGIQGDADFEALKPIVSAITPVPGGIGPMTVTMLLKNTVLAWKTQLHLADFFSNQ